MAIAAGLLQSWSVAGIVVLRSLFRWTRRYAAILAAVPVSGATRFPETIRHIAVTQYQLWLAGPAQRPPSGCGQIDHRMKGASYVALKPHFAPSGSRRDRRRRSYR